MNTIRHLFTLAAILATASQAPAAVPSAINYQGRLSNASGASQQGNRAMTVALYDAGSGGTLLYSENLGNVAVDANGVYAFQFGASGTSDTLVSETLATTDGTTLTYQKTLSHTPVLPGTVGVADGTFSWHETTGNPGSPAHATATVMYGFVVEATVTNGGSGYTAAPAVTITGDGTGAAATATVADGKVTGITITNAGSGYITGATITIAQPPAPFVVNYTGGTVTVTYDPAPPAGRPLTATYRYSTTGISGALAAGAEQWLELTVDGVAQAPRQKVLAVPFAMRANFADQASDPSARQGVSDLAQISAAAHGTLYSDVVARNNMTGNYLGLVGSAGVVRYGITSVSFQSGQQVLRAKSEVEPNASLGSYGGYLRFVYIDDTEYTVALPAATKGEYSIIANPDQEKLVKRIESQRMGSGGWYNPDQNNAQLEVYTSNLSSIAFSAPVSASRIFPSVQAVDHAEVTEKNVVVRLSNSTLIVTDWNQWVDIPSGLSVVSIEVRGKVGGSLRPRIDGLKILKL